MAASVSVLANYTGSYFSFLFLDSRDDILLADTLDGGQSVTVFEPIGQTSNAGSISELVRTAGGYSSALTTVAGFNGPNGIWPQGGLIADAGGNLYGVTWMGGSLYNVAQSQPGNGAIFEIAGGPNGYSSTVTTVASFAVASALNASSNGVFPDSLVMDAQGNLFGLALSGGGISNGGVLFELVRNGSGYSDTPIDLVQFPGGPSWITNPSNILIDGSGDLFGLVAQNIGSTTSNSVSPGTGAVFELVKSANGYAASPIVLSNFASGTFVYTLAMDANGNLFGSSSSVAMFEIAKTGSGYAPATTLVSGGVGLIESLLVDSNGDLFGISLNGGANGTGFAFELAKTASGYAAVPTIIASFTAKDGAPNFLTADKAGNLFGMTGNSAGTAGEVFEITGSNFAVTASAALSANQAGLVASAVAIADSAANVSANLDGLQVLAAAGKLSSVTLIDSGTPTLTITSAQQTADAAAIKDIVSSYTLLIGTTVTNTTGNQETLTAPAANTTLKGAGYDVLDLSGNPIAVKSSAYTLTANADGSLTITTAGSTDHVSGVLQIQFSDKTLTIAPKNSFGEYTALLYQGALGRTPEAAGLEGWDKLAGALPAATQAMGVYGLSDASGGYNGALSIAGGFTNSAEFVAKYGSLTDAQFVTQLYSNILDRAPDTGGFNSWIDALAPVSQGGKGETREHVLIGFAESVEAISNATNGYVGQSGAHAAWLFTT